MRQVAQVGRVGGVAVRLGYLVVVVPTRWPRLHSVPADPRDTEKWVDAPKEVPDDRHGVPISLLVYVGER